MKDTTSPYRLTCQIFKPLHLHLQHMSVSKTFLKLHSNNNLYDLPKCELSQDRVGARIPQTMEEQEEIHSQQ